MKNLLLLSALLIFACSYAQGEQLYADGTSTDQDGNTFEWINYSTQDWAIENAELVTYRDGTPIPQVTNPAEWQNLTTGAWCYYDNDPLKGKLYNWYAVAGIHDNEDTTPNKEFAPEGWHIPSAAEWSTLENYLIANGYNYDGTTEGNKLAKAMTSDFEWTSSNGEGAVGNDLALNNSSGFNAVAGGSILGDVYSGYRSEARFWVFTYFGSNRLYHKRIDYRFSGIGTHNEGATYSCSVRFVRNASSVGANGDILLNGTISAENNQIKNVADPTDAQDAVTRNYTYSKAEVDALIAEAVAGLQSQIDDLESDDGSGTVTDQGGNTYDYLSYGDQAWTVDNAEMVTYRDGTPIPQVTDGTEWGNLTTGVWCYYNNDETKGKLYNWYAVMGIHDPASLSDATLRKEFAPEGWHVPSDAEWTTLENYLIANDYNYDGTTTGNEIAKAMASITGWRSSTEIGAPGNDQSLNNSSGFNAVPEYYRNFNGSFYDEGDNAIFWSSTEDDTNYPWSRNLKFNSSYLGRYYYDKRFGFSVRFVRD
jgi:uncharacterized protein (TIGR02145 family)